MITVPVLVSVPLGLGRPTSNGDGTCLPLWREVVCRDLVVGAEAVEGSRRTPSLQSGKGRCGPRQGSGRRE